MRPKRVRVGKKVQVNWLSEEELASFKAYAHARGLSMTDLVREKIAEFHKNSKKSQRK